MSETESILLNELRRLLNIQNTTTLQEGLKAIAQNNKDSNIKNFINLLSYIIIENRILDDNSLLGFKEIICQKCIEILEENKFDAISIIDKFLNAENDNIKKIMGFSLLLGTKIKLPIVDIFFWILIYNYFYYIKKILSKFGITDFNNNKDFVNRICSYEKDDILKALNNIGNINIKTFLQPDNDHLNYINENTKLDNISTLSGINENNKNEIQQQNLENINDDKKEIFTSTTFNEDINISIKINEEERNKRIFKLINNSIEFEINKKLKENDILNLNYKKINENNNMDINNIIIDNYEIKTDKNLYLFSPISLLINEIKKEIEISDFEIFNKDNHYIELYGKYLIEIINKLNIYIKNGNEEKYIEENKINFGSYNKHFYLCCKFNEDFKDEYYKNINIYKSIRIDNNRNKETKKIKITNNEEIDESQKNNENNRKINSTYSAGRYSKDNYKYKLAYNLENEVRELLVTNKNDELQNLLFIFNLKVPKKNKTTIEFESVTLFFNSFYDNLYGFREIDVCSKNNKKIV